MNYLGSKITNDARRTREIKSRHFVAKSAFNKIFFPSKLDLNLRQRPVKCYVWNMVLKLGQFGK